MRFVFCPAKSSVLNCLSIKLVMLNHHQDVALQVKQTSDSSRSGTIGHISVVA